MVPRIHGAITPPIGKWENAADCNLEWTEKNWTGIITEPAFLSSLLENLLLKPPRNKKILTLPKWSEN